MKKTKPQYAVKDGGPLVRMQILVPIDDYKAIGKWKKKTSLGKIDLIRPAIRKALDAEAKRLKIKL